MAQYPKVMPFRKYDKIKEFFFEDEPEKPATPKKAKTTKSAKARVKTADQPKKTPTKKTGKKTAAATDKSKKTKK